MTILTPGATLPDFELRNDVGIPTRLSGIQGDDPLVLMIGRGEHCPRERQHQRELIKLHQWSAVAFTQMATILPNSLHDTSRLRISTGAFWPFLADEELEVQRTLDIREYTDPHHDANVPHTVTQPASTAQGDRGVHGVPVTTRRLLIEIELLKVAVAPDESATLRVKRKLPTFAPNKAATAIPEPLAG